MGQAEAESLEFSLDLPCGWQGSEYLGRLVLSFLLSEVVALAEQLGLKQGL